MGIGTIVIIILVVALAMGPVMLAMPSKRQSYLARLRASAQRKGFYVQLTQLTLGPAEGDKLRLAAYRLMWDQKVKLPSWRLLRKHYEHDFHFQGAWDWEGPTVTLSQQVEGWLKKHLNELPDSVKGVGADNNGVTLYWLEQGGEAVLEQVYEATSQLKTCLQSAQA